ncbi:MAG: ABC transporter permease [Alphaproteobacteria bacterium]|nr:ABC transporter permease [Alphaproteobacteria bacterium]
MSGAFLLRRLLLALPTLFGVAVIVFVLLRIVPGDPIAMMIGPGATKADIQQLREVYGLDKSIVDQFFIYLGDLAQGKFGTSISMRQDVMELIVGRLPVTIELCIVAMLIAIGIGGTMAVTGAYYRGRWAETGIDGAAGFMLAIPDFLWALLFILFIVILSISGLPISGRISHAVEFKSVTNFYLVESLIRLRFDAFGSVLLHMLLPALSLALPLAAIISRVLKTSLNEAMKQDYIQFAQVKGFSRFRIVAHEALRNALVPTVTLIGVQLTFLVGGTVLIEKIFSYPGIGNMAIDAVINRDLPLIQGLVLTFAVLFIVINLLVDMSYARLNPRMRNG